MSTSFFIWVAETQRGGPASLSKLAKGWKEVPDDTLSRSAWGILAFYGQQYHQTCQANNRGGEAPQKPVSDQMQPSHNEATQSLRDTKPVMSEFKFRPIHF